MRVRNKELVEMLLLKKLKIATAESCTGGLLAKRITDVSGASNVFEMGIISYSNRIKHEFLEISGEILETEGAVSEKVARMMAIGAADKAAADIGVGITGFAGPSGDDVGLVYVSVYLRESKNSVVKKLFLEGTREEIREQAANIAIEEVLALISRI